jgi:hypothetical protein
MFHPQFDAIERSRRSKPMNTFARMAAVLILGSGGLLAGCVSHEDLAQVRTIAVGADQKADAAIQRADMAGQSASMAGQKADSAAALANQAGQLAASAQQTANAANATASNAKGTADALQSAFNARTVALGQALAAQPRRLARGERG